MTTLLTSRRTAAPRSSGNPDFARARHLQLLQVAVMAMMAVAVVAIMVVTFRTVEEAASDHRTSIAFFAKLTEVRDQGRRVQLAYWEEKAGGQEAASPMLAAEVASLLPKMEQLLDEYPRSPETDATVDKVFRQLDLINAAAGNFISAGTPAERDRYERQAVELAKPLEDTFDDLAAFEVASTNARATELQSTTRTLVLQAVVAMVVVVGVAVLIWWLVERTRIRLLGVIEAAVAEQAALRQIAELVATEQIGDHILSRVAEEVATIVGGDAGWLIQSSDGELVLAGTSLHDADALALIPTILGGHADEPFAVRTAIRTNTTARFSGYDTGDGPLAPTFAAMGVSSGVAAPVWVDGEVWGALAVTASGEMDAGAKGAASSARLAGLALSNAQAHAALARRATRDALTALPNHGVFHDRLATAIAEARQQDAPLSVSVIDLDNFKEVNDTHGHQVGDRVLVEVAQRLQSEAGPACLVARVGGEEFAWIMPGANAEEAYAVAERARQAVSGEPVAGLDRVTISIGVCSIEDIENDQDVFRLADAALLAAKNAGRNITVRYTGDLDTENSGDARQQYAERARTLGALRALARAIDARDSATQEHSARVADLTYQFALAAGWNERRARQLREAALVHDVGKIGVPDAVLSKPGRLTDVEYAQIRQHAELGATIISEALNAEQVGWVRHHHERIDGGGYPDGLRGDDIPDGARLLAVADCWDAMTTDRSYRVALTHDDAIAELRRVSGSQLDSIAVAIAIDILSAAPRSERDDTPVHA